MIASEAYSCRSPQASDPRVLRTSNWGPKDPSAIANELIFKMRDVPIIFSSEGQEDYITVCAATPSALMLPRHTNNSVTRTSRTFRKAIYSATSQTIAIRSEAWSSSSLRRRMRRRRAIILTWRRLPLKSSIYRGTNDCF